MGLTTVSRSEEVSAEKKARVEKKFECLDAGSVDQEQSYRGRAVTILQNRIGSSAVTSETVLSPIVDDVLELSDDGYQGMELCGGVTNRLNAKFDGKWQTFLLPRASKVHLLATSLPCANGKKHLPGAMSLDGGWERGAGQTGIVGSEKIFFPVAG